MVVVCGCVVVVVVGWARREIDTKVESEWD